MRSRKDMERLLWHLIGGTRGGVTRARLIEALRDRPYNPNQLADLLDLDYTTIRYHLRKLEDNGVVEADGAEYGTLYGLTDLMEAELGVFEDIWDRIDKDGDA